MHIHYTAFGLQVKTAAVMIEYMKQNKTKQKTFSSPVKGCRRDLS